MNFVFEVHKSAKAKKEKKTVYFKKFILHRCITTVLLDCAAGVVSYYIEKHRTALSFIIVYYHRIHSKSGYIKMPFGTYTGNDTPLPDPVYNHFVFLFTGYVYNSSKPVSADRFLGYYITHFAAYADKDTTERSLSI